MYTLGSVVCIHVCVHKCMCVSDENALYSIRVQYVQKQEGVYNASLCVRTYKCKVMYMCTVCHRVEHRPAPYMTHSTSRQQERRLPCMYSATVSTR